MSTDFYPQTQLAMEMRNLPDPELLGLSVVVNEIHPAVILGYKKDQKYTVLTHTGFDTVHWGDVQTLPNTVDMPALIKLPTISENTGKVMYVILETKYKVPKMNRQLILTDEVIKELKQLVQELPETNYVY